MKFCLLLLYFAIFVTSTVVYPLVLVCKEIELSQPPMYPSREFVYDHWTCLIKVKEYNQFSKPAYHLYLIVFCKLVVAGSYWTNSYIALASEQFSYM